MEKSVDHEIWYTPYQWNENDLSLEFPHKPAFAVGDNIYSVSALTPVDYSLSKVVRVSKGSIYICKKDTIKLPAYLYETEAGIRVYDYNQPLRAFHLLGELIDYVEEEFDKRTAVIKKELLTVEKTRIQLVGKIRNEYYTEKDAKNV